MRATTTLASAGVAVVAARLLYQQIRRERKASDAVLLEAFEREFDESITLVSLRPFLFVLPTLITCY